MKSYGSLGRVYPSIDYQLRVVDRPYLPGLPDCLIGAEDALDAPVLGAQALPARKVCWRGSAV
jgi:hypothetical protein|tara:strand:+ start:227 stop:415 length:189 start_codon:yes stop_codon:yes gene_type:complete